MERFRKFLLMCLSAVFILSINGCDDDEPDPYKDDYESNNTMTEATAYTLGETISASIAKGDHDWYSFTPANTDYIDIILIEIDNNSTEVEMVASIYDIQGTQIGTLQGSAGQNIYISLSTRNGSYFIELSDYTGEKKGDYTLKIANTDSNDDNEPDDIFSEARNVLTYPALMSGTIVVEASSTNLYGDWEFFLVLVPAGKRIDFSIDPEAVDMELHFKIYSEGQTLVDLGLDGDDGETLDYYISNSTEFSVTYYIELGGILGDTGNGNYTISFTETTATKGLIFGK